MDVLLPCENCDRRRFAFFSRRELREREGVRFEGGLFREEADDIGRSGGCVSCGLSGL